jgi:dipeptidyl aminopeptidase/acylaminoacyl peptidase
VTPTAAARISYTLTDPEGIETAQQVEACLTLPPDYDPGRRYPVVIEVYPGTGGGCQTFLDAPRPSPAVKDLWASLGAIHVRPALPLDLSRTEAGPMAGTPALLEQTAGALIELGYADPDRIALFGFSQGALPALYTAARSDSFAAVIAMNGWAGLLSHYFGRRGIAATFHLGADGGDNRWRYDCEGDGPQHNCPFGFPASPFGDAAAAYARESPVTMAKDITAPVLLIHSDLDYFSGSQFDEMFGALHRAGREARYVRYWGEGHGPSSPANIRDLWARFEAFLNEAGFDLGAEPDVPGS